MAGPNIAFLHVGPDTTLPTIMVRSVRAANPDADIIQCTDKITPPVEGVDQVLRIDGDATKLMTFRLEAFSQLQRPEPILFLDTDMICVRPLRPAEALEGADVAVCVREYQNDVLFNPQAMGMNLPEYAGKTLGQIYPYLACAVITRTPDFWISCRDELYSLPGKFRVWFGDQEAMRNVITSGRYQIAALKESEYACLPDLETNPAARPKICHFKGPLRKPKMIEWGQRLNSPQRAEDVRQRIEVENIVFDLGPEDLADLALQRTGPLVRQGGEAALRNWFATGAKREITDVLTKPNAAAGFLAEVVHEVRRDVEQLLETINFSGVERVASIGPGLGLVELMIHRRHRCSFYLIDIETSAMHRHGYEHTGSGYANIATSKAFLIANGVPADQLTFCNPKIQPLDGRSVDLILSVLSMGFHYPMTEYVDYISRALRPGGLLVFDQRKHVPDAGWSALAPRFEEVSRADFGKAWRVVFKRKPD